MSLLGDHAAMMSDQSDRPDQPADQDPTDPRPTATDQAPEPVTTDEAATVLGITANAVRQRLKRGTLAGEKTAGGWVVWLPTDPPTNHIAGRSPTNQPPTRSRPTIDQPTDPVDLAPLAAVIERQGDEIRRLAEASTAWQFRALHAEERLKQLTAGEDAPVEHSAGTGEAERAEMGQNMRPWWRRLWER
jgi:hypothetical protein